MEDYSDVIGWLPEKCLEFDTMVPELREQASNSIFSPVGLNFNNFIITLDTSDSSL